MNINFETLEQIPQILEMMKKVSEQMENKIEKRWLNIKETAFYLGYSKDYIHKLKDSSFILNKHYYKKNGKLLFDKYELDDWVTTSAINNINSAQIANEILKDLI